MYNIEVILCIVLLHYNLQEYTLDDGLTLPFLASALNITLGDNSRLRVKNGFFGNKNRINSVAVQGSRDEFKLSQSHVVLQKHALNGVGGIFTEVSFRNLKSVILSEMSLDGLLEINLIVENIWQLIAKKEVFGATSFNAVSSPNKNINNVIGFIFFPHLLSFKSFSDVADLVLNDGVLTTTSFNLTKPKIFINRSWINNFHPMRGKKLTELRIENSEIGIIKSSAFNILELNSLILDNVKINSIENDIFREAVSF